MNVIHYFNLRTFLALAISQAAAFITWKYQIKFDFSLMLFSLCVVFPLHYSIQAAFKRRDRALEYFSLFKAGSLALVYSFHVAEDLDEKKKQEANTLLKNLFQQLVSLLETRTNNYPSFKQNLDALFVFIENNREEISKRNVLRMIRYAKDVAESSVYLVSLVNHRTMAGMRFYGLFFILLFPILQAPILFHRLENLVSVFSFHALLAICSLILITLSNFQLMIEYPFDKHGIDNIQLHDFSPNINS